ncbi:MAG: hypothetical protein ACLVIY_01555 [Anaerobutyricum soehngenii]
MSVEKRERMLFSGGRLGEYRYYDMDKVTAAALKAVPRKRRILIRE